VDRLSGESDEPAGTGELLLADSGEAVVEISGEIDVDSATAIGPVLDEALRQSDAEVVIDLTRVTFMDSSGIGMLISAKERADEAGVEIVLRSPSQPVRRVLELGGVADWFGLTDAGQASDGS
jgi:anti-sigma B factor antagonist